MVLKIIRYTEHTGVPCEQTIPTHQTTLPRLTLVCDAICRSTLPANRTIATRSEAISTLVGNILVEIYSYGCYE